MSDFEPTLSLSDLARPEILADPYPFYHRLRSRDPVYWDGGTWVLTGHAEVVAALHDPRLTVERVNTDVSLLPPEAQTVMGVIGQVLSMQMVFRDPPHHTRLRGLVNKAFTPRVVESMRARIGRIVDELLDAVAVSGRMDVIRDLAYPLPVTVIAEMLGVPPADRAELKRWSDDLAALLGRFDLTWDEHVRISRSITELNEYLRGIVAQRRVAPRDDLISALLAAEEHGTVLSEEELLANCMLLLLAGHETTTNLIGNGLLALLRHPDQLERLRAEPGLIATAVEELLRYDSPVQLTSRVAREELELGGKRITRGQYVSLVLGAANRDPKVFPEPDRLDVGRRENRHVAFGHGIHFCLGAALARLEGQIALGTLLRRMPTLRLETATPQWRANQALRGLQSLPVAF
jgi:cytochrome P450